MDAGGGMSQAAADAKYQPQWLIQEVTPVNNQSILTGSPNGESILLTLAHTATIATLTIGMPTNPKIGQFFEFNATGAVTQLIIATNGATVMNPPQQLAIGDYVSYRYTKTGIWMRRI